MSYRKISPRITEIGYTRKGNRAEEELVSHIDDDDPEYIKRGHKCLLSIEPRDVKEYQTVYREDFKKHWHEKKRISIREDLLERFVYDKVMRKFEENANFETRPLEVDYTTETSEKFKAEGFQPEPYAEKLQEFPTPSAAVTFWNENCKVIGTSRSSKRCTVFSKPIGERLNQRYL